ncbi:MAG TPA: glycine betaine ABC transporter substrate-binding protein [Anaerovoracaceae bacterium]|nr:glycine betaine ABC transporter substrate-binding protein [Anaerovoracaceae bacterium]
MFNKFLNKKLIVITLILSLTMVTMAGCGSDDTADTDDTAKETIEIGYVNWAECVAVSNIWKVLLEDEGYEVNLTQLDVAPLYVGLSEGDVDIFLDAWLPITQGSYWDEYHDKIEDCGIWYQSPAKIGVVVPEYVDIDSLEEFNSVADKFGNEIIGIDPGAGIMKASETAFNDYDLDADLIQGSEAAMMVSMEKAYEDEEWIAITGWSPHWMFASYDLKYLEDPKASYGAEEGLHSLCNKEFAEGNAEVANMIKSFKMTDPQIGSMEKLIQDGMDPYEAAQQWIGENQDVVDEWIK